MQRNPSGIFRRGEKTSNLFQRLSLIIQHFRAFAWGCPICLLSKSFNSQLLSKIDRSFVIREWCLINNNNTYIMEFIEQMHLTDALTFRPAVWHFPSAASLPLSTVRSPCLVSPSADSVPVALDAVPLQPPTGRTINNSTINY